MIILIILNYSDLSLMIMFEVFQLTKATVICVPALIRTDFYLKSHHNEGRGATRPKLINKSLSTVTHTVIGILIYRL